MAILLLRTIEVLPFQHSKTGIPAIGLLGSSSADGFTMSFAPIMIEVSTPGKSSFISSISKTISYGTLASAKSTFICPGILPATGWMAKDTLIFLLWSTLTISLTVCCACATAIPYPGIIITFFDDINNSQTSSASIGLTSP